MSRTPLTLDPWQALRAHTPARVALGRSGVSMPTEELLRFGAAHAMARDAVHLPLDVPALRAELEAEGWPTVEVRSSAPNRATYLLRPDLGRQLDDASAAALQGPEGGCTLQLVVADGLSSLAAARHAVPLLGALRGQLPPDWRLGPVVVATQARVALGDPIGERLGAQLVAVLIGERPGLSSPDSLGVYLTHAPRVGCTDAQRNCISNVRPEGLSYAAAAHKLMWLAREAVRLQCTGIGLKDDSEGLAPRIGPSTP
jgi:ethanolamine ammonia-lyase small subunit